MRLIPRAATLAGLLTIVGVLGIDATPAQAQYFGLGRGFSLSIGTGLGGYGMNYGGYGGYGLGYGGYGYPGYSSSYGYGYPGYSSYSYGYPGYSSYSYGYPGYTSAYSYSRSYGYPGYGYGYPGYGSGYRSYSSGYRGYGGYGGLNPTNTLGFPGGSSTVSGYYMPGYGFIR